MTAADRPSVTDNARDEAERRWPEWENDEYHEGHVNGWMAHAEWAAGRAETTTATNEDEDATQVIEEVLYEENVTEERDRLAGLIASRLTSRGLLATARTRPTEPTDAQVLAALNAMHPRAAAPSLDYWTGKADEMRAALRAAWTEADR